MGLFEIIAVIFSLTCVWLAVQKNVLNWPAGIVAVVAYFIVFFQVKLYADMCLQIIFLLQGIYGWYNWKKERNETLTTVQSMTINQWIFYGLIITLLTAFWSFVLIQFTDANLPIIDAFVAMLSLTANWLLARKLLENWLFWIVANSIYCVLFWYKELYLSSGIYIVFLVLAIKGYRDWKKISVTKKDLF
jgi:nicotinamide mononucleotide transporter